jgi:hypothetical protein
MATTTTLPRYSPSGFFRPTTFVFFLAAAAGALAVSFFYQLGMHYIPRLSIYLSIAVCVGFGFALGAAAGWAVKAGHCRNRLIALMMTLPLAGALLGGSFLWAYRQACSDWADNHPEVTVEQVREAKPFMDYIGGRVEGGWQMTDHGRDGAKISGVMVWMIWGVEGLILFGFAVALAFAQVSSPYCERCNQWAKERKMLLQGVSRIEADPLLQSGDLDGVIGMPLPAEPNLSVALALTAQLCPQCKETGFLTIEEKRVVAKKRGKPQESKVVLVKYAVLRADQRARFLDRLEPGSAPPAAAAAL